MEIIPQSSAIGAEVRDLDLFGNLSDETIARVNQAFLEYQVLFFRDQQLTPQQYNDFAERFGAEVIAGKGRVETREGPQYARQLIVCFESYEQALACYESPEYQVAMKLALQASERELSIVEG
ncbi:MAG: DUF1330 domain-containing protein [Gammaproteobacteria bacterium]|nr:DUF1330 domain-containing protein [Gammaproteobacteria bacterium]